MRNFLIFLFLPVLVFSLEKEKPLSFKEDFKFDIQFIKIQKEFPYEIKEQKGAPLKVGLPINFNLELHKIGDFNFSRDGKVIWQIGFEAPSFFWLSFEFEYFKIPEDAQAFIYRDENLIFPLKTKSDGIYIIPPFPSNKCILEIDFGDSLEPFSLGLSTIFLGFKDFLNSRISQYCEVDINCPEGSEWQNEKRSVAGIYFSGYFCTGALINNVRKDCKNYFLTAHHCINDEATANRSAFYWNYEWKECGGGELLYGDYTLGSTLRATNQRSDFSLLEILSQPDAEYKVYYSGWSIDSEPPTGAAIIHHPDADAKKISIEEHTLIFDKDFWKVPHYEVGATEPGSSGSPIYNMNHKIIGQLYGGYSTCDKPRNDFYGSFHISWDKGTSASTRLKDWLDPDNTGVIEVDGMDSKVCYKRHTRPFDKN